MASLIGKTADLDDLLHVLLPGLKDTRGSPWQSWRVPFLLHLDIRFDSFISTIIPLTCDVII